MIYWLKTGKAIEDIETFRTMDLPLEIDSLDYSGNDNDGTATNIIYSDTPDMRMYLPLTADDDDDSDFAVTTTPINITYGADGAIFNGTSSKISCGNIINDITGCCFTFDFKRNGIPSGNEYLFNNYVDANNRIMFGVDSYGLLYFQHVLSGTASDVVYYKSLNLCDNLVHKVALNIISSTTIQITVDNSADTIKTLTIALSTLTAPLFFLSSYSAAPIFEGTIKNFRIFNRNLTTAAITQLYTYNTFTALSKAVAVFNGSTSNISCGNVINDLTGVAISLRFKRNRVPSGTEVLLINYVDANNRFLVYLNTSGYIVALNVVSGSSSSVNLTNNLCDGIIHNVVLNIIDSTHLQFIIDNIVKTTLVLTVALTALSSPVLKLGINYTTVSYFNGCISDFYIFNRNLTKAEISYLYTYGYVSPYLYDSDSDCFPLDTNAIQINLDNPQRKYNVKKIIGNGASISGGDYYGDRKITFSRIFKKDGVSTSGALTVARNNFINKYVTLSDDLYLIRDYNTTLQFIQVYPSMGSEKYKNLLISEDFDITLYCALPFFTDADDTVSSSFSKTSRYFDYDLTIVGLPVPMIFEGTFSSNDTNLVLGVFENFGVSITYPFLSNDVVKFDSGSMRLWVNGVERFNAVIVGTPFVLLSGATTLRIECIADMTACTVTYTGRYI